MMQENKKYSKDLLISIVALTLAIVSVGTLYVRDLFQDNSTPSVGTSQTIDAPAITNTDVPSSVYDEPDPSNVLINQDTVTEQLVTINSSEDGKSWDMMITIPVGKCVIQEVIMKSQI